MGKLKWNYNPCKEVPKVRHKQGDICRHDGTDGTDPQLVIIRNQSPTTIREANCMCLFITGPLSGQNINCPDYCLTPMTACVTAEEAK